MIGKSVPVLREWELNENSTRYDHSVAAPSDDVLFNYWLIWAGVALTAGTFTFVIFLGIVSSKKVRQQPFNLYLIYLMIPDFMFSILCGLTCLLNALHGKYLSHWMCNFQQWYCVWGIGSNCWLNALITRELYRLLWCSKNGKRYVILTTRTVSMQALAVYVYCGFLGTWGLVSNIPFHAIQIRGLACIPVEMDLPSSLVFWMLFMPLFSVIPIAYVIYVTYQIYKHKLLPPSGKRRLLGVYFGRIIAVFLFMWGPYFLLNYIVATWLPTLVVFIGGTFSHLQGPISATVSLLKPDVRHAVKQFLSCQVDRSSQSTRMSMSPWSPGWSAAGSGTGSGTGTGDRTGSATESQHLWPDEDSSGSDANEKHEPAKEQAIVDESRLEEGREQHPSTLGNPPSATETAVDTSSRSNPEHKSSGSSRSINMSGEIKSDKLMTPPRGDDDSAG